MSFGKCETQNTFRAAAAAAAATATAAEVRTLINRFPHSSPNSIQLFPAALKGETARSKCYKAVTETLIVAPATIQFLQSPFSFMLSRLNLSNDRFPAVAKICTAHNPAFQSILRTTSEVPGCEGACVCARVNHTLHFKTHCCLLVKVSKLRSMSISNHHKKKKKNLNRSMFRFSLWHWRMSVRLYSLLHF